MTTGTYIYIYKRIYIYVIKTHKYLFNATNSFEAIITIIFRMKGPSRHFFMFLLKNKYIVR